MATQQSSPDDAGGDVNRRDFLKVSVATAAAGGSGLTPAVGAAADRAYTVADHFDRADSLYHGDGWESLNPGYWGVVNGALRRRLRNVGDRARATGFPYHWETHRQQPMPVDYDPSLPFGMIWRRDWKLSGNYAIRIEATIRELPAEPGQQDDAGWRQHQAGYALLGICFGGDCLFESWHGRGKSGKAAWMAAWRDDGTFGIYDHASDEPDTAAAGSERASAPPRPGDRLVIDLAVTGADTKRASVTGVLSVGATRVEVRLDGVDRRLFTDGYFGVVGRGLLDFEVNRVLLDPASNQPIDSPINELHVAYPLGDTLQRIDAKWQCRFIALFRSEGDRAEVRVSDSPDPPGGWEGVPVAGSAPMVNNDFRRNTAVLDVMLPADPSSTTLYYTVWKDGRDVTTDPRTGWLGQKNYVGRLPRLRAPYRLCGLSCHAIVSPSDLPSAGLFEENWVHDQPTPDAFRHLEDYNFQVMVWEDDVWYLELVLYPPSTDDAYKIINTTIAGPTTRWQMMRHWNVINPGDHDHGMDDVKGPEQIALRNHEDLGQDRDYMRRNFQIVSHLISGDESPDPARNPKRWRRWKMPAGDFSLLILDARLWRSSQDTHIWDDEGWGHKANLYDRSDPTRSLLGEEQFAWLQQVIRTDSSRLICLTGINGLHTIWTGVQADPDTGQRFNQRDRVAADFAGWVKAGTDRVLHLLGSRDGVASVYGDVHNGSIVRNTEQRLYECSFGPIGRYGGRSVKEGFGPQMTDYDDRQIDVLALYHREYGSPNLKPLEGPKYWNFLEMYFDTGQVDPVLSFKIRNLLDAPSDVPRGGGHVEDRASQTGRRPTCTLPPMKTLANAEVRLSLPDGTPIRATRALPDGRVPPMNLPDIQPGARIVVSAFSGQTGEVNFCTALAPN